LKLIKLVNENESEVNKLEQLLTLEIKALMIKS